LFETHKYLLLKFLKFKSAIPPEKHVGENIVLC